MTAHVRNSVWRNNNAMWSALWHRWEAEEDKKLHYGEGSDDREKMEAQGWYLLQVVKSGKETGQWL